MEGASSRAAMRELLRRGLANTPGMDELARRVWQRRAEITRHHRLDGTLQQVRELSAQLSPHPPKSSINNRSPRQERSFRAAAKDPD